MFAIINIIIVISTSKSHARTWSLLQDDASQFYILPFWNPSGGNYSVVQGFLFASGLSCSMAFFLVSSIRPQVFPLRQQSSSMIILWEKFWQRHRIHIIDLKVISPEKHWLWIVCVGENCHPIFKFSSIFPFRKMHHSSNWEM